MSRLIALLALLLLTACATAPDRVADRECAVTMAVLAPILNAASESGNSAELAQRTSLWPEGGAQAWSYARQMGFAPVWRSGATEQALRRAYWDAYYPMQQQTGLSRTEREFRAWEAAYSEVGDDRIFAEDSLWAAFFDANDASIATPCVQRLSDDHGAALVRASAPREATAVRIEPARPVFSPDGGHALIAARSVYPELNPGDGPRTTGTVWYLTPRSDGSWRVMSARRTDLE